jgi:hypothetical protein
MRDRDKRRGTRTLRDGDVSTRAAIGRRAMLVQVGVVGAGALAARDAAAQEQRSGVSDRDGPPNPYADQPYLGRGYGRNTDSAVTDRDQGAISDPPNNGRGPAGQRMAGVTDRDERINADPPGNGRGPGRGRPSGQTDQDQEPMGDPPGNGRGPHRTAQQVPRGK